MFDAINVKKRPKVAATKALSKLELHWSILEHLFVNHEAKHVLVQILINKTLLRN